MVLSDSHPRFPEHLLCADAMLGNEKQFGAKKRLRGHLKAVRPLE